jgi:citrate/tricarballylate utilization protein
VLNDEHTRHQTEVFRNVCGDFGATPAYGLVPVAHLATIVVCFAVLPYTRFVHAVYRFLAIVADNTERRRPG